MGFTYKQARILSIIPHVTGPFSVCGSAWIMYEVISDRTKWSKPYHRLLFAMCVFDVLSSIALGLSTWPIPSNSPGVYSPVGTIGTCTAQAFFIQANIASPIYNFMLSMYYLLLIKYGMTQHKMAERVEPVMQAITIIFALGTSFVSLGLGLFNDSSLWCWINASPKGCEQSYKFGDTTCERGNNAEIFRWAFFFAPLWACILGTMVTMGMLWWHVKKQEKKALAWNFANNDRKLRDSVVVLNRQKSQKKITKSQIVAAQAFRYVAVFYVTWVAGTINRLLQLILGYSFFWLMALHAFFTPMQGFFNFLVYMYPKYKRWKENQGNSTHSLFTGISRFSIPSVVANQIKSRISMRSMHQSGVDDCESDNDDVTNENQTSNKSLPLSDSHQSLDEESVRSKQSSRSGRNSNRGLVRHEIDEENTDQKGNSFMSLQSRNVKKPNKERVSRKYENGDDTNKHDGKTTTTTMQMMILREQDVLFNVENHPGTKDLERAVCLTLDEEDSDSFEEIYDDIFMLLQGRTFYIAATEEQQHENGTDSGTYTYLCREIDSREELMMQLGEFITREKDQRKFFPRKNLT